MTTNELPLFGICKACRDPRNPQKNKASLFTGVMKIKLSIQRKRNGYDGLIMSRYESYRITITSVSSLYTTAGFNLISCVLKITILYRDWVHWCSLCCWRSSSFVLLGPFPIIPGIYQACEEDPHPTLSGSSCWLHVVQKKIYGMYEEVVWLVSVKIRICSARSTSRDCIHSSSFAHSLFLFLCVIWMSKAFG